MLLSTLKLCKGTYLFKYLTIQWYNLQFKQIPNILFKKILQIYVALIYNLKLHNKLHK